MITSFYRSARRFLLMSAMDDGGGGGAVVEAPAPAAAPVEQVTANTPPAAAAPVEAKPTMLDAMFPKAATEQPRDAVGRFLPKTPAEEAALAAQAKPAAPTVPTAPVVPKPETPEDITKMPEGLQPKAQERFQALANTNRELSTKVETLDRQVSYIRETFQSHGITQPQFEQAAQFVGAINKGDFNSALQILDQQRMQLALAMGKPLPGVDALSDFPDLRQEVDNQQITEARALEIARHRLGQHAANQHAETQRQAQQNQQQEQKAVEQGLSAVDKFCRDMQATDIDFASVEAKLLPRIQSLIAGVPPHLWVEKVKTHYELIKEVAAPRPTPPQTFLRPTGTASPSAVPKSMHEAMWGRPA